jgi:hypothetical protein
MMKILLIAFLTVLLAGCISKSNSRARVAEAYMAGQREAASATQKPSITVLGDVKNHSVPWAEDSTLARALLAAEFQGLWDPHQISITRGGETYNVKVRSFLAGAEDPPLEPGDIIEVHR